MRRSPALLALVGALLAAACSGAEEEPSGNRVTVSRSDFGEDWPLTVEEGTLACDGEAVSFTTGGTRYGVNGTALTRGLPRIDPIWAAGDIEGTKKDIGRLLDRGLDLCD